ncbi:hypothetical protein A5724_22290 [Mycobacterium sp. ACS1612]|nr:hypothetical protein [Mycobacterium sp. ACS1612]OBF31285.1 hypothetical protein A5724_22290 [Mycobacterium sp. ACS1612]
MRAVVLRDGGLTVRETADPVPGPGQLLIRPLSAAICASDNDSVSVTAATHKGATIQFGGGPHPVDWYGTIDAVVSGRLDTLPSIGRVIGLDEVPDAVDLARKSQGPPRVVVHPTAT